MRREKSLSILSRKFIQMFLEGKMLRGEDVISLETVAKTVLAATSKDVVVDGPKVKTRVRRLYDIANVLSSVGLIKKIRVLDENEASKAAFRWTGVVSPRFLRGHKRRTTSHSTDQEAHRTSVQQEQIAKASDSAKARLCYTSPGQAFPTALHDGVAHAPPNNFPAYLLVDFMQTPDTSSSLTQSEDHTMRKAALMSVTCPKGRALPLDSLPNPLSMLEYHQKKLKSFMLRYCSQWHNWQQMARECRSNGHPTPPPLPNERTLKSPVPMQSVELLRENSPALDPALIPLAPAPDPAKVNVVLPTTNNANVFTTSTKFPNKLGKFSTQSIQQWRTSNLSLVKRENCENANAIKSYKRPRSLPNLRHSSADALGMLGRSTTGAMDERSPSRRRRIAKPNLLNDLSPNRWGNK